MKRKGDIVFINRRMPRGGNMGSVPQLWLKMHRYQGGEEGAKGLVTSFFHLPDLEGERKGVKPWAGQERKSPPQAPCPFPHRLTWRVAPAPPYSPVSPDPTPPNHCAPAAESAAPASATQRSTAQQTVVPRGQGSGPPPAWKRGCGSGSSGSRWSCERK